jgi:hypothetical protein
MSHSNNMMLRAKVNDDGSISGFELGNYSGGDTFCVRLHRLASGDFYWVVEGNGYGGTLVVKPAFLGNRYWTSHDLDELGLEILKLWREDGLEERDARMRDQIKMIWGEELPFLISSDEHGTQQTAAETVCDALLP